MNGKLGSRIASFKLGFQRKHAGRFSYLPSPPDIEALFSIRCRPNDESTVSDSSIAVTVDERDDSGHFERRNALLSYADDVGAYPDIALNDSGLVSENYYFLADEEWTGAPTGPCLRRPSEQAARLFTATEALGAMRHLRHLGFMNIRRIQDLRALDCFPEPHYEGDAGVLLCARHTIKELGLTINLHGVYGLHTKEWAEAKAKRANELSKIIDSWYV